METYFMLDLMKTILILYMFFVCLDQNRNFMFKRTMDFQEKGRHLASRKGKLPAAAAARAAGS
jgi:hypothetical protein